MQIQIIKQLFNTKRLINISVEEMLEIETNPGLWATRNFIYKTLGMEIPKIKVVKQK